MKVEGACHCGHVTFEAEIDPESVFICHCTDCQTLTSSAYRVAALHDTKVYGIRIGTLKQRLQLAPIRQLWHRSALPWASDLHAMPPIEQQ